MRTTTRYTDEPNDPAERATAERCFNCGAFAATGATECDCGVEHR